MTEATEAELAGVITAAINRLPSTVIERLIEHKILALYKRQHSVEKIETEIGRHVSAELSRLGWRVEKPDQPHLGSPPPHGHKG